MKKRTRRLSWMKETRLLMASLILLSGLSALAQAGSSLIYEGRQDRLKVLFKAAIGENILNPFLGRLAECAEDIAAGRYADNCDPNLQTLFNVDHSAVYVRLVYNPSHDDEPEVVHMMMTIPAAKMSKQRFTAMDGQLVDSVDYERTLAGEDAAQILTRISVSENDEAKAYVAAWSEMKAAWQIRMNEAKLREHKADLATAQDKLSKIAERIREHGAGL